jgi:hypothetical protein
MSEPEVVTVQEAYYDANTDSVCWVVKLASGKEAELFWLREEFGPTFKLNPDHLPPSLIQGLCDKMVGKEIRVVVGG